MKGQASSLRSCCVCSLGGGWLLSGVVCFIRVVELMYVMWNVCSWTGEREWGNVCACGHQKRIKKGRVEVVWG